MGYLDNAGLRHFTDWVRSRLSGKQDALTPGSGIVLKDGNIGVALPAKTVTEAEYNALTEAEKQAEVLYAITDDAPGGGGVPGGGCEVYSTEETRIGTWINGKPLYRRIEVLRTGATAGTSIAAKNIESWNIDTLKSIIGVFQDSVGTTDQFIPATFCQPISSPFPAILTFILRGKETNDQLSLMLYVSLKDYTNKKVIVTVEYTKTTDEGGAV